MNSRSILIAGGGPAGSTLAAILAKEGMDVTVLDKAKFPRPHIGEALQPAAFELLDFHLGLGPLMRDHGFIKKYGAIYEWGENKRRWSVLFDDRLDSGVNNLSREKLESGDYAHSFQVDRGEFDQLLLDHAQERGATIRQGVEAVSPLLEGERVVGLTVRDTAQPDLPLEDIRADFVVDATGPRCLLGRTFNLTRDVQDLQATATWCYVTGAGGVGTPLNRNVQLVVTVPEGWVWFIPLSEERTSIGVVTHERKKVSPKRFWEILGQTTLPLDDCEIEPGPKGNPYRHMKDWSYTHKQFVGPGWMMVGDAACFTDPILSGGVDFAIRGACNAAVAILRGSSSEAMGGYQTQLRKEFNAYLRLARYWYANNRAVDGLFWEMHKIIPIAAISTPLRAFKYLTSGACDADAHFHVFTVAQEEKIFQQLGVDETQLKKVLRRAKRHLENPYLEEDGPDVLHEG
jgi:flavin-dependent dehydrogenase